MNYYTKFRYKDTVIVDHGFYKGQKGTVIDWFLRPDFNGLFRKLSYDITYEVKLPNKKIITVREDCLIHDST